MAMKRLAGRTKLAKVCAMCVHASLHSLKFMTVLKPLDLIKSIQAQWQTGLVNAPLWNKEQQTEGVYSSGETSPAASLIKAELMKLGHMKKNGCVSLLEERSNLLSLREPRNHL